MHVIITHEKYAYYRRCSKVGLGSPVVTVSWSHVVLLLQPRPTHKTVTPHSYMLFFKKMGLNIYFAGSISGGREDAAIYKEIYEKLKQYGTVLSPFVADPSLSLDQTGLEAVHNCS